MAAFSVYQILNPQFHFFALRINFTLFDTGTLPAFMTSKHIESLISFPFNAHFDAIGI